ncbi:MAG: ATP-binding cassette domain-containing protein, partial [Spirochaetes bacterium]|nr:ATP-binding cassette domain-containing protein [Spirochaetota bacterium]
MLEVNNIVKSFGGLKAVNDCSIKVEEGSITGLIGPNGAGKTTTLKMLSGIVEPTNGEVKVLNYTPIKRQKEYQKQ